jgi:hypothetical protein
MTNEERQKLCAGLRHAAAYNNPICDAAAEEIERLAAALAQSNVESVACAIANRSNELGLDLDGAAALHGICQEELERAAPQSNAELGDFAKYAEQFNKEALERALAEPIPRSPAAQKLINDTLGVEDEMELITKIRNYEALPRPDTSAGLIKAAEIASAFKGNADRRMRSDAGCEGYARACDDLVAELRARATDRSEK